MNAGMMTPPLASMISASGYRFLADFDDLRPLKGDGAVLVIPLRARVAGDETTVGDKFHKFAPPFSFAFSPPRKRHRKGKEKSAPHTDLIISQKGETVQPVREALRCSYQTVI
jgi:hypothetical protein